MKEKKTTNDSYKWEKGLWILEKGKDPEACVEASKGENQKSLTMDP